MKQGTDLGPYRVVEKLGEGGMGEVWLADDTRLGRKVAIKVLPAQFASDPERLARFEQEARASAALNHPHIAAVYDVGEADGTHFMVQEFLEGHTLQAALMGGGMPLKRTLVLGAEIASALAAAHEAGIVHRDLKPANVFVSPEGHAKVLDFGLAKLTETSMIGSGDASMSPTMVGTMAGQIMGTAGYMAPEQIHGEPVDRRADLFAFGCVLYEMLTGQRAFDGKSVPDTLAQILHQEPVPATDRGAALAPPLQRLLTKCLAKDRTERYQHADDLAVDLRHLAGEDLVPATAPVGEARPDSHRRVSLPVASGMAMLAMLLGGLAAGSMMAEAPVPAAPTLTRLTNFSTAARWPAVSPSGQMIAFVGEEPSSTDTQIFVKQLPDGPPLQLTNTPGRKDFPAFSPDGTRIAFTVMGQGEQSWNTWTVPLVGGEPRRMLSNANALTWTPDGRILFSQYRFGFQLAIVIADESGANAQDVWVPGLTSMAHFSDLSPDGTLVAIGDMGEEAPANRLGCFVRAADDPEAEMTWLGGPDDWCSMQARFSADGRWVYFLGHEGLWRSPATGGEAVQIVGSDSGIDVLGVFAGFDLTPDDRAAIVTVGEYRTAIWLREADGRERAITFEGDARSPRFSADGRAVFYVGASLGKGVVWRYDRATGSREMVCPGQTANSIAVDPSGERLLLTPQGSDGGEMWSCDLDGSAPPGRVERGGVPLFAPDGSDVYFVRGDFMNQSIWRGDLDGGEPVEVVAAEGQITPLGVSSDGEWLSVVRRGSVVPRETWLYPTSGQGEPRFVVRGWNFVWSPGSTSWLFVRDQMVSTAWALPNPNGQLLPDDLPEEPDIAWFAQAGARQVFSATGFTTPVASPVPFETAFERAEMRSNLYRVALPQ